MRRSKAIAAAIWIVTALFRVQMSFTACAHFCWRRLQATPASADRAVSIA